MPTLFAPPPLSKNCTFSDTKERRQFPKERENLRGGYIYSYIYSELGLVLELFLEHTSEKRIKLTTHRKTSCTRDTSQETIALIHSTRYLTDLTVTCVIYLEWYLR